MVPHDVLAVLSRMLGRNDDVNTIAAATVDGQPVHGGGGGVRAHCRLTLHPSPYRLREGTKATFAEKLVPLARANQRTPADLDHSCGIHPRGVQRRQLAIAVAAEHSCLVRSRHDRTLACPPSVGLNRRRICGSLMTRRPLWGNHRDGHSRAEMVTPASSWCTISKQNPPSRRRTHHLGAEDPTRSGRDGRGRGRARYRTRPLMRLRARAAPRGGGGPRSGSRRHRAAPGVRA